MIDGSEKVVRVLFPNKVLNGRVMGGAFVLRSQRREQAISVFRMAGPTFSDDLHRLDAGRNLHCSVLAVGDIRKVEISQEDNRLTCDVVETGDLSVTSHAGITVTVNGEQLIGGCESQVPIHGDSIDALVLAMQHRLTFLAQQGLTRVNDLIPAKS